MGNMCPIGVQLRRLHQTSLFSARPASVFTIIEARAYCWGLEHGRIQSARRTASALRQVSTLGQLQFALQ
jgi:hypothetical protein